MLKLSENPPQRYPESAASIGELTGQWWVAHTKARNEKAFAWDLIDREIAYYLPMIPRVRFSGGRKRRSLMPLFPSYVFVNGTPEQRIDARATDRLCQMIPVPHPEKLIKELQDIDRAITSNATLDLYPVAAAGQRCRIARGPLKNIEGIVIRRGNSTQMVLQVSMLGRGAMMEIEADMLDTVE